MEKLREIHITPYDCIARRSVERTILVAVTEHCLLHLMDTTVSNVEISAVSSIAHVFQIVRLEFSTALRAGSPVLSQKSPQIGRDFERHRREIFFGLRHWAGILYQFDQ